MPENDQSKWVGIRPVNPAENIPVTESAPLTSIKVSPLLAGTLFNTETQKRTPALGDLSAVCEVVRVVKTDQNVGAPNYTQLVYTVPADRMFYLEVIECTSWHVDPNTCWMGLQLGATKYYWQRSAYGAANSFVYNDRSVWYNEGEKVIVYWNATLAGTSAISTVLGYLTIKY